MKNLFLILLSVLFLAACGEPDTEATPIISAEDQQSLEESSLNNPEEIVFKGKYKGTVDGQQVFLELDESSFSLKMGGKSYSGEVFLLDDGRSIELVSQKGTAPIRFLSWSDAEHLLLLSAEGEFLENDVFLDKQ